MNIKTTTGWAQGSLLQYYDLGRIRNVAWRLMKVKSMRIKKPGAIGAR